MNKINDIMTTIADMQKYLILISDEESSQKSKLAFLRLVIKYCGIIINKCKEQIKELENQCVNDSINADTDK